MSNVRVTGDVKGLTVRIVSETGSVGANLPGEGVFLELRTFDALRVEQLLAGFLSQTPYRGDPPAEAEFNRRLWDLVRYQRDKLLDEGLITLREYTHLVAGRDMSQAARRLEDYDAVMAALETAVATGDTAELRARLSRRAVLA